MNNRPFWNFLLNLSIVKWFCNLRISKKLMQYSVFQKLFNYETITYLFFGVATTVVNFVIFWIFCVIFQIPMENPSSEDATLSFVANTIAFVLALIFAFVTNKYIVFSSRDTSFKKTMAEFVSFTIARLFTFFLESAILTVSSFLGLNLMAMKIFAGILVVILNYIFSKLLIFKSKE